MKMHLNPITLFAKAIEAACQALNNLFFNDTREFKKLKTFLTA